MENDGNKVLLAVLAHPDDESFGMGGTLALYAYEGISVYLICATRGEAGDIVDEKSMHGYRTVAEAREAELRCAAGKLGLKGVFFLGYRDSGMEGSEDNRNPQALAATPLEQVSAKIVHYIRMLKPQVVVTFDPIGGYRHPDHIACHKATVLAFDEAGRPDWQPPEGPEELPPYQPAKLYFYTISRRFLRIAVRMMPVLGKDPHKFGRNGDIDLTSLAVEDFPVHARVDYKPVKERKMAASACHASQGGAGMASGLTGLLMRLLGGTREEFMRAYPPPIPNTGKNGNKLEQDLFEGVM